MSHEEYLLSDLIDDLRKIVASTNSNAEIVNQVRPLAKRLSLSKDWVEDRFYDSDKEQGFGAYLLHEEPDHSLAVFAVSWLPGRGAPPHNHGSWAVVAGVDGFEKNVFWKREHAGSASVKRLGEKRIGPGDVLTFSPDAIHSVVNDSEVTSISLHLYGMHLNHTGRSQFDPEKHTETPFVVNVIP